MVACKSQRGFKTETSVQTDQSRHAGREIGHRNRSSIRVQGSQLETEVWIYDAKIPEPEIPLQFDLELDVALPLNPAQLRAPPRKSNSDTPNGVKIINVTHTTWIVASELV